MLLRTKKLENTYEYIIAFLKCIQNIQFYISYLNMI